ncbi:MAG: hypothetical protein IKG81_06610 [Bacteroidales bacterium]|nr:hypothetical protein [Bacteroidales bacterium]
MKKTFVIITLLLSIACQAQEKPDFWHRPFWHNFTVGTEFCHTVEPYYGYDKGLFRNHPNNSANLVVSYDVSKKWSFGAFVGYYGSHRETENWPYSMYTPENGTSSKITMVNEASFSFGLEATFHLLPLLYKESTPFDLSLSARVGRNPRNLDIGLGIGLGYSPLKWLTIYGKAFYGAFGFPNGMQESGFHNHLVFGVNVRPFLK